jgi:ketosteroid isomerase-like protein
MMKRAMIVAFWVILLARPIFSQEMSALQKEVWQMEETVWRDIKTANEQHYLSLWHDNFLGWPYYELAPVGKTALAQDVHRRFARNGTVDYEFLSKSVRVTGDIGITQYAVRTNFIGADGTTKPEDRRITHTWLKTAHGWKILAGMSASIESAEPTR